MEGRPPGDREASSVVWKVDLPGVRAGFKTPARGYARAWHAIADHVRETHRHDLLQVLAYANTADHDRVTTCLVYPCRDETWESLRERSRLVHRTELGAGERQVELMLAAAPIGGEMNDVVRALSDRFSRR